MGDENYGLPLGFELVHPVPAFLLEAIIRVGLVPAQFAGAHKGPLRFRSPHDPEGSRYSTGYFFPLNFVNVSSMPYELDYYGFTFYSVN